MSLAEEFAKRYAGLRQAYGIFTANPVEKPFIW